MESLQPSKELVTDVVTLLKREQKPLFSDEIAGKLNRNTRDVLGILLNSASRKVIRVIVNKENDQLICSPSYTLKKVNR